MSRVNASPAGHTGLIDNAIGVVSALFAYVETRAALLAVESKALLLQLVSIVAFGLGALIAGAFGYIFLAASLIVGMHMAQVFPGHGLLSPQGCCTSWWRGYAYSWRNRSCAAGFILKRAQN
jgi:hypothetical protein